MEDTAHRQVVYLPVAVAGKALEPMVLLGLLQHEEGTGQRSAASYVQRQTSGTELTVRMISYGNLQGRDGEELQSLGNVWMPSEL